VGVVDNIVTEMTACRNAALLGVFAVPVNISAGHPAGTSEECDFRPDGRTRWTRQPRRLLFETQ